MSAPAAPAVPGGPDSRPVPDPTVLTTQLVDRAIAAFREVMEARLDGMDRATGLLAVAVEQIRTDTRAETDRHVEAIRELVMAKLSEVGAVTDQKFLAVAAEIGSMKSERDRTAEDSKVSLKAAFDAAALAVAEKNKANDDKIATAGETARRESDNFVTLMTTSVESLQGKINDIKERVDKSEGKGAGVASGWAILIGAVGLIATLLVIYTTLRG